MMDYNQKLIRDLDVVVLEGQLCDAFELIQCSVYARFRDKLLACPVSNVRILQKDKDKVMKSLREVRDYLGVEK